MILSTEQREKVTFAHTLLVNGIAEQQGIDPAVARCLIVVMQSLSSGTYPDSFFSDYLRDRPVMMTLLMLLALSSLTGSLPEGEEAQLRLYEAFMLLWPAGAEQQGINEAVARKIAKAASDFGMTDGAMLAKLRDAPVRTLVECILYLDTI